MTKLNITLVLLIISSYHNNANFTHIVAVIRILQYIKKILDKSIHFSHKKLDFKEYTDANYDFVKENKKLINK